MKRLFLLIPTLFAIACCTASGPRSVDAPVKIPLADPFILLYDGVYYAYGTGAENGIEVWTSCNLVSWKRPKVAPATDWLCTVGMSGAINGSGRPRFIG